MKKKRFLASLLSVMMAAGCTASDVRLIEAEENDEETGIYEYSEEEAVSLTLMHDSAEASGGTVRIDGTNITVTDPGIYVVTGELDNGRITVDSEKDGTVQLVFMNVKMTSGSGPVLFVENAEKTVLTAEAGTTVTLAVSGEDAAGKKAAVHAKDDLVISGTGSFIITSADGDGIHANDDLTVTDADVDITAASDGIDVNSSLTAENAKLGIDAGKDGIHAGDEDNEDTGGDILFTASELVIIAEDDGVQAAGDVTFAEGIYDVTAGGGSQNAAARTGEFMPGGFPFSGSGFSGRPGEGEDETSGATMPQPDPSGQNGQFPAGRPQGGFDGQFGEGQQPEAGEGTLNGMPFSRDDEKENVLPEEPAEAEEDTSEKAKGISAEGTVTFESGTFIFDTADDAVNAAGTVVIEDGSFTIKAGDDALHTDDDLAVAGGTVTIESSYEGLEGKNITVSGGEVSVKASDDGINSVDKSDASAGMFTADSSKITFSGGTVTIDAGGDGIDSNGSVILDGGKVIVYGPLNSANGALDSAGSFTVKSGSLMAGGSAGMAQVPVSDGVNILVIGANGTGTVTVKDEAGSTVAEYSSEKSFQHLVIADEAIRKGGTYTVYQGGTELGTVTVSESVTRVNISGNTGWGMPSDGGMSRPGQGKGRRSSSEQETFPPEGLPWGQPAEDEKDPL